MRSKNTSGYPANITANSWNCLANHQHALNKTKPVKVYTKEEIEAYKKKRSL